MAIYQNDFLGEGYLGLFGFATDSYALMSNRLSDAKKKELQEHLGVEIIRSSIFSFSLAGIMSAGNSDAVLVPYLVEDDEVEKIGKKVDVSIVPDRFTALGNLIATNDRGAMISDIFSKEAKEAIDSALGLKSVRGRIADSSEVGALCTVTNKGFVVTPDASDEEIARLEEIFQVPGGKASANMGSKAVGACLIANSNGLATGRDTTPIEMEYIIEGLGFL